LLHYLVQRLAQPQLQLRQGIVDRFTPVAISAEKRFACPTTRLAELSNWS
jgi:hypothetical protein